MEIHEIIEKIDKFFDKHNLNTQDRYNTTKFMNQEYWEKILNAGEEEVVDDDFEDFEDEEEIDNEEEPKKIGVKKVRLPSKPSLDDEE